MLVELEDDPEALGPRMRALTQLQRNFVRLYVDFPRRAGWRLAKAAGYKNSPGGHRVTAHRLMHDDKVKLGIAEEMVKRQPLDAAFSRAIIIGIAKSDEHPLQLKAATALGDRSGFAAVVEQRHVVEHTDRTGKAMVERLRELAVKHGLDPERLIGGEFPVKQIEAKADERPVGELGAQAQRFEFLPEGGAGDAARGAGSEDDGGPER